MTRLASYASGTEARIAVQLADGRVVDLHALDSSLPTSMRGLIEGGHLPAVAGLPVPDNVQVLEDVTFLPPVPDPSKVVCVAVNNSALAALASDYPESPTFFLKAPSSLVGHGEAIKLPREGLTHPEAELAAVIGRKAKNVPVSEALSCVAGYTILNDVTSPAIRKVDLIRLTLPDSGEEFVITSMGRHKGTDTFGPMGPWLTTVDEIPDPDNLGVRVWLGDVQVAEDSTANLRHGVAEVIASISSSMTLLPGDVISFGTAVSQDTWPLHKTDLTVHGGPVRIEIDGLGLLESPVHPFND